MHTTPAPPEATNRRASLRHFQRARLRDLSSLQLAERAASLCSVYAGGYNAADGDVAPLLAVKYPTNQPPYATDTWALLPN